VTPRLADLRRDLRQLANPEKARLLQGFFKTGPGEYGEGDVFLGIAVPQQRKLARRYAALDLEEIGGLLAGGLHEERVTALLLLVNRFRKAAPPERQGIYSFYLKRTRWINNWDLVDCSAPYIVGPYLEAAGGLAVLDKLARSRNLWERRIAMLSTFHFIRLGDPRPALRIARILLRDEHDLIHKAVGWMLREVGKRTDAAHLERFLDRHCRAMPRTALRYAIERLPEARRRYYLAGGG
jgi:3-methyladenine DNA glycosylase AlkD